MFGVHPDLRRYVSVAFFLSAAVGLTGLVFLALGSLGAHGVAVRSWPFVIFGVVAMACAYLGMIIVPRSYRYASRVVASVTPTAQQILLGLESDSDSTSLYATPLPMSSTRPAKRVALLMPAWSVEPLLAGPIEVSAYLDPTTSRSVAFGTSRGILWCLRPWQGVA
jgi:hypothetical protein